MNTIREILERHAESGEKLTVERFVPDRRDFPEEELIQDEYILIKGSAQSLRFVGELLIRFADGDDGCSFEMHPNGAGSEHFARGLTLGVSFVKSNDL